MTTDHIGPGSGVGRDYFYFPGGGTYFGVDPKLDMVYLMMQQTQNERGRITPAFKALVYDCYPEGLRRP